MKTVDASNHPVSMLPRIPTMSISADVLPRPAVIGLAVSCGSYPDSTAAIKEILSSVLNISSGLKSKLMFNESDFQDSDAENWENNSSDGDLMDDFDPECIPINICPLSDVRFSRNKASWDNTQTDFMPKDAPKDSPPKIKVTNALKDTTPLEFVTFPKHEGCTEVVLTGSEIISQVNLPLMGLQKETRRFSSPNLVGQNLTLNQNPRISTSGVLTLPSSTEISDPELYTAQDGKSFKPRSLSYANIHQATEGGLISSNEALSRSTEDLFEQTLNLEKENSHFIVSDLIISAVEKMKCSYRRVRCEPWNPYDGNGDVWGQTDHEDLSYPRQKNDSESATSVDSGYEGFAVLHLTSDLDPTPEQEQDALKLSSPEQEQDGLKLCSESEECDEFVIIEVEDYERTIAASRHASNTPERPGPEPESNSAEDIAQQLYRVFRKKWLQTEAEVQLPGLPDHFIQKLVSKEAIAEGFESSLTMAEEIKMKSRIRGTSDWAPPRFQIICTIHHALKRDVVVASQNYLCTGCGTKLEPKYIRRLRYCDYLGKYFCDCCHGYAESSIPGRILMKWDFSKYYVCNFAKRLVDHIWRSHYFDVQCINKALYTKVKDLDRVKEIQEQLILMKKLLKTCRFAKSDGALKAFRKLPSHLTDELHLFTLYDLVKVKQKLLLPVLRELLTTSTDHVDICELCQAKGFVCEFCQSADIIFPFQTATCSRCEGM
ncbi:hypothetical protein FKM82_009202 [Ascaphus truei]